LALCQSIQFGAIITICENRNTREIIVAERSAGVEKTYITGKPPRLFGADAAYAESTLLIAPRDDRTGHPHLFGIGSARVDSKIIPGEPLIFAGEGRF